MQREAKLLQTKLGNIMTRHRLIIDHRVQLTLDEEATNEVAKASCQRLHISRPDETSNLMYAVSNPQTKRELRHDFPNLFMC